MSKYFSDEVWEAVKGLESITAEGLAAKFPGRTKREVTKAFQNLRARGLMRPTGKVRGDGGVYVAGAWEVVNPWSVPQPQEPRPFRVSCVWGLCSAPVEIPWMPGRKYQPLGAWA